MDDQVQHEGCWCLLQGGIAYGALSLFVSLRNSSLATQPSWVLIQQSRMILSFVDLIMILFWWSLVIFFSCKILHVTENRFTHALGQNFMGQRVWIHSVLSTCPTLIQSLPFFIAGMFPELPWIYLLMLMTLNRPVLLFAVSLGKICILCIPYQTKHHFPNRGTGINEKNQIAVC